MLSYPLLTRLFRISFGLFPTRTLLVCLVATLESIVAVVSVMSISTLVNALRTNTFEDLQSVYVLVFFVLLAFAILPLIHQRIISVLAADVWSSEQLRLVEAALNSSSLSEVLLPSQRIRATSVFGIGGYSVQNALVSAGTIYRSDLTKLLYVLLAGVMSPVVSCVLALFWIIVDAVLDPLHRATSNYLNDRTDDVLQLTYFRNLAIADPRPEIDHLKLRTWMLELHSRLANVLYSELNTDTRRILMRMTILVPLSLVLVSFCIGYTSFLVEKSLLSIQEALHLIIVVFGFVAGLRHDENRYIVHCGYSSYAYCHALFARSNSSGGLPDRALSSEIRFQNVGFQYPESPGWALKDISMVLRQGQSTALIGLNGSGKSTICNLLREAIEPTQGQIARPRDLPLAYCAQNVTGIPATVGQYLSANGTELSDCVRMANDLEISFSQEFLNLSSLLNESPSDFAKLRFVMTVLSCQNSTALLILDEPIGDLGPADQLKAVTNALSLINRDVVTVIVTHNLALAEIVDQVVVLEGGKIVESGTSLSLRGLEGRYSQFCRDSELA